MSSIDVISVSLFLLRNDKNWYLARMKSAFTGLKQYKKFHDNGANKRYDKVHVFHFRLKPCGYKTFFMLNSTEHEISTAHKNENAEK